MLVLTRKMNESIIINDDIRITVVGIRGNQVRLGIEAPETVPVFREELRRRVEADENRESSAAADLGTLQAGR